MREMKESGVKWIGEIPQAWEIRRIKHVAVLAGRIGWQGLTSEEYIDEGAYLITGIDFCDGKINWDSCVHVPLSRWEEASQIQVKEGDLLITKDGTVGKVALALGVPAETSLNSGVLLIRNNTTCSTRFLFWMLQSEVFWKWFGEINAGNSTIIHLYQHSFENFSFPFPKKVCQERIANYLDAKCSQIDNIISKQEQIIEKLKEYKLSLITEVVTKGLDPDVEMKDIGNIWLERIPAEWIVCRVKNIYQNIKNAVKVGPFGSQLTTSDYTEDGKWVYNQRVVLDNNFVNNDTFISNEKYEEMKGFAVEAGDILVTTRGTGTTGHIAKVPDDYHEGILHPCLMRIKHNQNKCLFEFLYYIFEWGSYVREQINFANNTSSLPVLYSYTLNNLYLALPSIREQREITDYLNARSKNIDESISEKEKLIEKLREYKKSLIYEVVTGKKEV